MVEFKPGDVALYELNPNYHVPNRPFFDVVELKGGGDAASAARAVIQTGEFDYAWNLQVEKDVLERIERQGSRGKVVIFPQAGIEHIQLNRTDPWTEVDGERSSLKAPHPFLTDLLVRQAYDVAVDRRIIAEQLYGAAGQPTSNFINSPKRFQSPNTSWEFSLEKAAQRLDQAGWKRGSDGFRVKDGRRMKIVYQTSVNPVRQKTQAIVKKAFEQIGIEVELKAVNAGVYFSSDPANPDTYAHFYADIQMYSFGPGSPDPQAHLNRFLSGQMAQKANNWSGRNIVRWSNAEYDRLWKQAETELDPTRRAALIIRMNDMLIKDVVLIPVVWRNGVRAVSHTLHGMELSDWDSDFGIWHIGTRGIGHGEETCINTAAPCPHHHSLWSGSASCCSRSWAWRRDPFEELALNPNIPAEVRLNLRQQFGLDIVPVRYVRWFTAIRGIGDTLCEPVRCRRLIPQRCRPAIRTWHGLWAGVTDRSAGDDISVHPIHRSSNRHDLRLSATPCQLSSLACCLFYSSACIWTVAVYLQHHHRGQRYAGREHFRQAAMPIAVLGLLRLLR
jgi:hypothetical protein